MATPSRFFRPRFLALGAFAGLSVLMISWLQQALYPVPPVRVPAPPPPLSEVSLPLPTGEAVVGWAGAPAGRAGAPVVLFFHGNGENLETMRMAGLYDEIARLGVAFLAVWRSSSTRAP